MYLLSLACLILLLPVGGKQLLQLVTTLHGHGHGRVLQMRKIVGIVIWTIE